MYIYKQYKGNIKMLKLLFQRSFYLQFYKSFYLKYVEKYVQI